MNELFGIYWGAPQRLILFPIVLLFIYALIKNYSRIIYGVSKLIHTIHQKVLFKHFSQSKQLIKMLCLIGALISLFIALLQPQWDKKEQQITQEGRDLLVVLDISRSMLAQDLKPNRLDFIKLKIRTLLSKLKCERVGLILFSGTAFVQCPLTVDYTTFLSFLEHVDVETISSGTTAIDTALKKAIDIFAQIPNRENKLVLLASDGEDFSMNLRSCKEKAQQENIKVFALGIGTPDGAPVPIIDERGRQKGHETDQGGNIVLTKLNEPLLKEMCTDLNGYYLRATYDDSDVDYLIRLLSQFERETFDDKKLSMYEDQYPILIALGWLLLAIEWIL